MENTSPPRSRASAMLSRLLSFLFIAAVVGGGYFVVRRTTETPSTTEQPDADTNMAASEAASEELTLPAAKVAEAHFATEPVKFQQVAHIHTVSGRLAYDEARHIEVKSPVSGVLVDVLVKPGDQVSEGQVLAYVNSPEIGQARATVLNETAREQIVVKKMERLQEVTTNLRSLFQQLDNNVALDAIEKQYNDKSLGTYREQIMAAYSQRLLANHLAEAARPLSESGSLPLKTLRERENDRHLANARFRSVRESTAYNISMEMHLLEADLAEAKRQVLIAVNHLETLLGFSEGETKLDGATLSRMEIRAPFTGTIESRTYARSERIEQSDSLFVLANTESLYVTADIRENDLATMTVSVGQQITVIAPAMEDQQFTATVHYVGREVERESNSLPLIATIENKNARLRPGMFVRVSIPITRPENVKSVRSESVLQHDNEQFVFIPVSNDTFRRVDVTTGGSNDEWVEIVDGLEVGQPVVSEGAFLLKSELLLASEE